MPRGKKKLSTRIIQAIEKIINLRVKHMRMDEWFYLTVFAAIVVASNIIGLMVLDIVNPTAPIQLVWVVSGISIILGLILGMKGLDLVTWIIEKIIGYKI